MEELSTWCIVCVQKRHPGKPFYLVDANGRFNKTARRTNLQKTARGTAGNDHLTRKSQAKECVNTLGEVLTLGDIADKFTIKALGLAADWVTGLCKCLFLLYGCTYCHRYPLKGCHWWRMSSQDTYDPTSGKKKWKCAFCNMYYDTLRGSKHRILIFADPEDENDEVQIARIGSPSDAQETLFRVFQLARILEDTEKIRGRNLLRPPLDPVNTTAEAMHGGEKAGSMSWICLLYTSPSPRDGLLARMPSSA